MKLNIFIVVPSSKS